METLQITRMFVSRMPAATKILKNCLSNRLIDDEIFIANFHGHALSVPSLIKKSMKKSMSTVKAREFPEFGELKLCVIANR